MISDALFNFCTAQDLTGAAAFEIATNYVDMQELNITTAGEPLYIHMHIDETIAGPAGATSIIWNAIVWPEADAAGNLAAAGLIGNGEPSAAQLAAHAYWQILASTGTFLDGPGVGTAKPGSTHLVAGRDYFLPISGFLNEDALPRFVDIPVLGLTELNYRWLSLTHNTTANFTAGMVTATLVTAAALRNFNFPSGFSIHRL